MGEFEFPVPGSLIFTFLELCVQILSLGEHNGQGSCKCGKRKFLGDKAFWKFLTKKKDFYEQTNPECLEGDAGQAKP